jgi:hypothetical protein
MLVKLQLKSTAAKSDKTGAKTLFNGQKEKIKGIITF